MSEMTELAERLKDACHGHPHAKIPWPHRILHEAAAAIERLERERDGAIAANKATAAAIERLDHECQASMATIASERARAEVAEAEVSRLRAENEKMREALKPSAATKAAYIGEFTIAVERIVNDDEEPIDDGADAPDPYDHIQVPWTTIKEIMAAIRARAALESKE